MEMLMDCEIAQACKECGLGEDFRIIDSEAGYHKTIHSGDRFSCMESAVIEAPPESKKFFLVGWERGNNEEIEILIEGEMKYKKLEYNRPFCEEIKIPQLPDEIQSVAEQNMTDLILVFHEEEEVESFLMKDEDSIAHSWAGDKKGSQYVELLYGEEVEFGHSCYDSYSLNGEVTVREDDYSPPSFNKNSPFVIRVSIDESDSTYDSTQDIVKRYDQEKFLVVYLPDG